MENLQTVITFNPGKQGTDWQVFGHFGKILLFKFQK
jgi:hypothetical protein